MAHVVKVGGSCLAERATEVAGKLHALDRNGTLVVAHGFGPRLRSILGTLDIPRRSFVSASGMPSHFTDPAVLAASILAAVQDQEVLRRALGRHGLSVRAALGSEGILGGARKVIRYCEAGVVRRVEDDRSASITAVDADRLERLSAGVDVLLVAPLVAGPEQELLVCDSDHAAAALARSLAAQHLTFLTDVDGFIVDDRVVPDVSLSSIPALLPVASGGMRKKLVHVKRCLEAGVGTVRLRGVLDTPDGGQGTLFHV